MSDTAKRTPPHTDGPAAPPKRAKRSPAAKEDASEAEPCGKLVAEKLAQLMKSVEKAGASVSAVIKPQDVDTLVKRAEEQCDKLVAYLSNGAYWAAGGTYYMDSSPVWQIVEMRNEVLKDSAVSECLRKTVQSIAGEIAADIKPGALDAHVSRLLQIAARVRGSHNPRVKQFMLRTIVDDTFRIPNVYEPNPLSEWRSKVLCGMYEVYLRMVERLRSLGFGVLGWEINGRLVVSLPDVQ